MTRGKRIFAVLILLVLLLVNAVHAQTPSAPLIVMADGDLWAWNEGDAAMRQLTQSGAVLEMTLSPDGSKLAYTQYPDIVQQVVKSGAGPFDISSPTDIWVLDIASGSTSQIATQPPDASFNALSTPDKMIVRSRPVWSPDGTKLAWTEYPYPELSQQLMIDDLSSGQAQAIVKALAQPYGVPAPIEVLGWVNSGIVLVNMTFTPGQDTNTQPVFLVYQPDGIPVSATPVEESDDRSLTTYFLLTDQGKDYAALQFSTGAWNLLDLTSGERQVLATIPERYSALSPDTSLSVLSTSNGGETPALQILDAQGNAAAGSPLEIGSDTPFSVAISPDGQTLAYRKVNLQNGDVNQFLTIWWGGQVVGTTQMLAEGSTQSLISYVWGPTAWRLSNVQVSLEPPPPVAAFECPGSTLPPRLAVGDLAQVTAGGGPNNMRDAAGLSANKIGEIPPGGVFSIAAGPVCADSLVWFQVYYNGQRGWTVEGQNGTYYLEPVQ